MSWRVAVFTFLTLLHIQIVTSCRKVQLLNCPKHDILANPKFHAFISIQDHMQICSDLSRALRCALDTEYLNGCDDMTRVHYVSMKNVMKVVCEDRKQDYFDSLSCFLSDGLEQDIQECLNIATYLREDDDVCEKIEETRECVYNFFNDRNDKCNGTSRSLMGKLVFLYFKPKGPECNIKPREGEEDPTTTSSTQSTTSTTTTELTTGQARALGVRETQQPGKGFNGACALLPSIALNTLVLVRWLG